MAFTVGERTIRVYRVNGDEYTELQQAVEAVLRRALGGYLKGDASRITISDLAKAAMEPGVVEQIRSLIRALNL